jgi:hypothetical protein
VAELFHNCPARGIAEGVEDTVDIRLLPRHVSAASLRDLQSPL